MRPCSKQLVTDLVLNPAEIQREIEIERTKQRVEYGDIGCLEDLVDLQHIIGDLVLNPADIQRYIEKEIESKREIYIQADIEKLSP